MAYSAMAAPIVQHIYPFAVDLKGQNAVTGCGLPSDDEGLAFSIIADATGARQSAQLDSDGDNIPDEDQVFLPDQTPLIVQWRCPDYMTLGMGRTDQPIDWNCNGMADGPLGAGLCQNVMYDPADSDLVCVNPSARAPGDPTAHKRGVLESRPAAGSDDVIVAFVGAPVGMIPQRGGVSPGTDGVLQSLVTGNDLPAVPNNMVIAGGISTGTDHILHSRPQPGSDDQIVDSFIAPGPDGICQTAPVMGDESSEAMRGVGNNGVGNSLLNPHGETDPTQDGFIEELNPIPSVNEWDMIGRPELIEIPGAFGEPDNSIPFEEPDRVAITTNAVASTVADLSLAGAVTSSGADSRQVQLSYQLTNAGPEASSLSSIHLDLPPEITFASCSAPAGGCTALGQKVVAQFGSVPPGSSVLSTRGTSLSLGIRLSSTFGSPPPAGGGLEPWRRGWISQLLGSRTSTLASCP